MKAVPQRFLSEESETHQPGLDMAAYAPYVQSECPTGQGGVLVVISGFCRANGRARLYFHVGARMRLLSDRCDPPPISIGRNACKVKSDTRLPAPAGGERGLQVCAERLIHVLGPLASLGVQVL